MTTITNSVDIPVGALKAPTTNPNHLDAAKFEALKSVIARYGFLQPILVRRDMTIVDGVHRVEAAKALGLATVPAVVQDLDEAGARLLQISMNRLRGELDLGEVASSLQVLEGLGVELDVLTLTGYSAGEVESLLRALDTPAPEPRDASVPNVPDLDEGILNPKPFVLELTFATRKELADVKKALRKAAGGGRSAQLEKGLLALIKGG